MLEDYCKKEPDSVLGKEPRCGMAATILAVSGLLTLFFAGGIDISVKLSFEIAILFLVILYLAIESK